MKAGFKMNRQKAKEKLINFKKNVNELEKQYKIEALNEENLLAFNAAIDYAIESMEMLDHLAEEVNNLELRRYGNYYEAYNAVVENVNKYVYGGK